MRHGTEALLDPRFDRGELPAHGVVVEVIIRNETDARMAPLQPVVERKFDLQPRQEGGWVERGGKKHGADPGRRVWHPTARKTLLFAVAHRDIGRVENYERLLIVE